MDKTSSLAQIIKSQHNLRKMKNEHLESILGGKTNHKVLLLLDGYDEYKRGTNKETDGAIENKIGNCFLILTSRPGNDSGDRMYVTKRIRNRMDGEIVIEGFSSENIKKFSIQYLRSEENSELFLTQARQTELSALLHVPIVLLMGCTVFISNMSLPHSKTKLYGDIFDLIMDRTSLKTFGCKSSDIPNIDQWLSILGKLSWKALQNDTHQLLLNKVDLNKITILTNLHNQQISNHIHLTIEQFKLNLSFSIICGFLTDHYLQMTLDFIFNFTLIKFLFSGRNRGYLSLSAEIGSVI